MELSVIVPVYNESGNLPELYKRLKGVLEELAGDSHEIIFVDDGSTDNSYDNMVDLHDSDTRVSVIQFTRNFGQHPALIAGLRISRGDRVVLLDADLQYPPEEIPKLVKKLDEGYDCVFANRGRRKRNLSKTIISKAALKVLGPFFGNLLSTQLTSFKVFNRELVHAILENIYYSRILTGLSVWMGFSHVGIDVKYEPRAWGHSKYNFRSLASFLLELITSYSTLPLRLTSYFGLVVSFSAFIFSAFFLVKKIFWGIGVPGYASLIVTISFFSGVQLLALGVIGEYISRISRAIQKRPAYMIKQILE